MARRLKLDVPAIGENFVRLLDEEGLDIETLSNKTDISLRKLRKLTKGKGNISIEIAFTLSKALNTSMEGFLFFKGEF